MVHMDKEAFAKADPLGGRDNVSGGNIADLGAAFGRPFGADGFELIPASGVGVDPILIDVAVFDEQSGDAK